MAKEKRILIVDDDPHTLQALNRLFQKDYKVLQATSGKEGLEILKKNHVSAIICDQRMPGMTGTEVLEKSLLINPRIIRILITAYTDIEAAVSAINKGHVYHFETKPWDRDKLKNTVKRGIEALELEYKIIKKNKELKRAYKKLLTLDRAKDQFLNMISHELKTPLTSIIGLSQILVEDSEGKKELSASAQKIMESSERLLEMTHKIILLSQLEAGTYRIRKEKRKVKEFLLSVIPRNSEAMIEESILNRTRISILHYVQDDKIATPPAVSRNDNVQNDKPIYHKDTDLSADSFLIDILFKELLKNAHQYASQKDAIAIQYLKKKNGIHILITNPCKDISREDLKKLGTKLSFSTSKHHYGGGLGLGLPLCTAIMSAHGGNLKIHSKNGEFQVSLSFPS